MPFKKEIDKVEEWERKNLVANLPTDFDEDFWESHHFISPTAHIDSVIASISKKNNEIPVNKLLENWSYQHKNVFVAYQNGDSIVVIPTMKSSWKDDETGGMLYLKRQGDFIVETKISISKRSDPKVMPDKGFQQAGIIVRNGSAGKENNILLCLGTAGSSTPKFFLRTTSDGKSKTIIDKIDSMNAWLRLEKKGTTITAYSKFS